MTLEILVFGKCRRVVSDPMVPGNPNEVTEKVEHDQRELWLVVLEFRTAGNITKRPREI